MNLRIVKDFLVDLSRAPAAAAARTAQVKTGEATIGYIGWVGHANLGDEAMFEAISRSLTPLSLLPLLPAPGERFFQVFGLGGEKHFAAVLLGGGTLINRFYLDLAKLAASWGVPFCVAGSGVGSPGFGFSSEGSEELRAWTDVLRRAPLVGVRGPESARLLRQAGIPDLEVIGDPALSFTPDMLPPLRAKPRLAINLGPARGVPATGVAAIARRFLDTGGELVGLSLGDGDEHRLDEFRRRYRLPEMNIEYHRTSGPKLITTLAGSQALITVRLHAAVLATCVGVPPVLFAYRSKCMDFMSSVNLETFAVPVSDAENGPLLQQLLDEARAQPHLRPAIHRAALAWKQTQRSFFMRVRELVECRKK